MADHSLLLPRGDAVRYLERPVRSSRDYDGQDPPPIRYLILAQAEDRFAAGVASNIEVVQAQDAVASSDLDYITSLFAHNLAKLSVARALGHAEEKLPEYLKLP